VGLAMRYLAFYIRRVWFVAAILISISGSASAQDLAGSISGKVVDPQDAVLVYTNTAPVARREVTRTANREYNLWLTHNLCAGYGSYFEWEPSK
jgi:hypothetical protein